MKSILIAASMGAGMVLASLPAKADLQLCNRTASKVQAAVGYKDKDGWVSEGWWSANPQACMKLVQGNLQARYYYIYAIDRQKGGNWGGKALFCMKEKIFTIRGINDCVGRGFEQQGFFEVDTGEKADWTVNLSDDKAATSAAPAPAPQPAPAAAPATGTSTDTNNTQAQPVPLPAPLDPAKPADTNTQQGQ
jgi:uncharacterized membrane protein